MVLSSGQDDQNNSGAVDWAWFPRRSFAWLLTALAFILLLFLVTTAFFMFTPVDISGIGRLGQFALNFSSKIWILGIACLILAIIARRYHSGLLADLLFLDTIVAIVMSIAPNFAIWRWASRNQVSLSVGDAMLPRIPRTPGKPSAGTRVYSHSSNGNTLELNIWDSTREGFPQLRPAVIRIKGGAWMEGGHVVEWNHWFNALGYIVVELNFPVPQAASAQGREDLSDLQTAIEWVFDHAGNFNIDPARISLAGYSAGSNLAMLAAFVSGDSFNHHTGTRKIKSVINFYGPTDLMRLYTYTGSPHFIRSALVEFTGGTPFLEPDQYRQLSPVSHVRRGLPPTISLMGESDRFIPAEQAILLDQALSVHGVHHELYLIPWTDHGFDACWNGFATQIARSKIRDFLLQFG
jgi:acetyl esterase/lipase